jgi:hypothetical protein
MTWNEFRRPVSVDFVPRGSLCEWCGKPAERRLTAIGGVFDNESGMFCRSCGEKFSQSIMLRPRTLCQQPADLTQSGLRP